MQFCSLSLVATRRWEDSHQIVIILSQHSDYMRSFAVCTPDFVIHTASTHFTDVVWHLWLKQLYQLNQHTGTAANQKVCCTLINSHNTIASRISYQSFIQISTKQLIVSSLAKGISSTLNFHKSKAEKKKKKLFGCPPLIFENWKKFLLYKSTLPLIFRIPQKSIFFFENFDLLKICCKLLFSTCLHFNTGFKLV